MARPRKNPDHIGQNITIRLPKPEIQAIDRHGEALARKLLRGSVSRTDALRHLVALGIKAAMADAVGADAS